MKFVAPIVLTLASLAAGQPTQPAPMSDAQLAYWTEQAREVVFIGDEAWSVQVRAERERLKAASPPPPELPAYLEPEIPQYVKLKTGDTANTLEDAAAQSRGVLIWKVTVDRVDGGNLIVQRDDKAVAVVSGLEEKAAKKIEREVKANPQRVYTFTGTDGGETTLELAGAERKLPTLRAAAGLEVKADAARLAAFVADNRLHRWPVVKPEQKTKRVVSSRTARITNYRTVKYWEWDQTWKPIPAAMIPKPAP